MKAGLLAAVLLFFLLSSASGSDRKCNFYFRQLGTDQGLSNGNVHSLLKDKDGYLWIGTYNGLNRFDGIHFKTWKADPSDSTQLPINRIHDLAEDEEGNIWCASDAGISMYDKVANRFVNYSLKRENGKTDLTTIFKIVICRNGAIVTQSFDALYVLYKGNHSFQYYPLQAGYKIYNKQALAEDALQNKIWIATTNGLLCFNLDKRLFEEQDCMDYFHERQLTAVTTDNNKNLVLAAVKPAAVFSINTQSQAIDSTVYATEDQPSMINYIYCSNDGRRWFSKSSGRPFTTDRDNNSSQFGHATGDNYSIASDYFADVIEDADGTLFFATLNGVSFVNPSGSFFSIVPLPESAKHIRSYYISFLLNSDRQNNIWLAPSYSTLLKYDVSRNTFFTYDFFPQNKYNDALKITCMEADSSNLYFGTIDGIYIYHIHKNQFEKLPVRDLPDGKYILAMELTADGKLWFTSHQNGVFCYDTKSGQSWHYLNNMSDPLSFTSNYIFDIHEDAEGTVWFVAEYDGLIRFNAQMQNFEYAFRNKGSAQHPYYTALAHDKDNNIWLLNYMKGLMQFNPGSGELRPVKAGLLSNLSYTAMAADKSNNLWLANYYQYSILDMETKHAVNFDIDYARSATDYSNHFLVMDNGLLVSETNNAFIIFNPGNRTEKKVKDPVNITAFSTAQSSIPFPAKKEYIDVSYRNNSFSIDFSTLSFLKNPDLKFSYMLDGFDEGWIECGNRQSVYYSNVPGGNYIFKVRVLDQQGRWIESKSQLPLKVSAIFYATIWFKLLLLGILSGLIFWYYKLYSARQRKARSEAMIAYFANSAKGQNRVDEILWDIAHHVIERSEFVDCVIYLIDERRNVLVQKAAYGNKNPEAYNILQPLEIPLGKGIVGSVALTGIPELIGDTSKDSRYIADDDNRYSELTVPIKAGNKVIGVIDSEHHKKNYFTQEHLEVMKTIASITGNKIMNAKKETEIKEKEKRLEDLKLQMAYTRQQALRSQMNPHFIFNCLNSINGFILKNDASTASSYLIKFSRLIRLILEHSVEKSISLQSELDALRLYIDMESLRFDKKFSYSINVDDEVMADAVRVPPLLIQPFVENAIWHGLLHKETPGELSVNISINGMIQCVIEDNGIGRDASAALKASSNINKKSLGMRLTRERLEILNEQENRTSSLDIIDLKNDDGSIKGTRVVIQLAV